MLLTTVFESYSIVSLSSLISLQILSFDSWGLTIQSSTCIAFTVCFLTLPFLLMGSLAKRIPLLGKDVIQRRYGKVYEDLELKNGWPVFFWPAFFLIRRLILAVVVVCVPYLIGQFYLVWAQSIISVMILGHAKPLLLNASYKREFFNEVIMMWVLATMICFSNWLTDMDLKV